MIASDSSSFPNDDQEMDSTVDKDALSLETIQERCLGLYFRGYRDGSPDNDDGRASHVNAYLDSLLTQEFTNLSFQEREISYEELHGVNSIVNETPELVANSLVEMNLELDRISRKDAYLMAEKQNKTFLTNPNFRLCFLRADRFDPRKAARRLVDFMEGKLHFFGESLLTKQIQFTDLDKDDQECLEKGKMQVLPARDRGGRPIFCDMNMVKDDCYKRPVNRLKAIIYILMTLAEDEENQRRGFVTVLMQLGSVHPRDVNVEMAKENPRVFRWAPIRLVGVHFCSADPVLDVLARVSLMAMPSDARSRHRMHNGSHTELLYSLLTFGIPIELFPMTGQSVIKTTNHKRWIARRLIKERQTLERGEPASDSFDRTDLPTRQDVLIGKGKPIQTHVGNMKLRLLVDDHWAEYSATPKGNKAIVIHKVVDAVRADSGRFLVKDRIGWWTEVSNADAFDKVSKTFLTTGTKMNRRLHAYAVVNPTIQADIFRVQKRKKCEGLNGCCT